MVSTFSLAYFPFSSEDISTIGRKGGLEIEGNTTYFRLQVNVGLSPHMDISFFVPYSKFYKGDNLEGFNDAGFILKHILSGGNPRFGYSLQVNIDTGRKGIGYGKSTFNFYLVGEYDYRGTTYNVNLVYIKAEQVEELRDSFGVIVGLFRNFRDVISYGVELNLSIPEDKSIDAPNAHLIVGCVYHMNSHTDISLGLYKTLTYHPSFVDYGALTGVLVAF